MNQSETVEDYCTNRSWRLGLRLADSRWLIGLAREELPDRPPRAFQDRIEEWHSRLESHLKAAVRHKYKNPAAVWILLNVIVPIVVKLVMQWWLNRKE